MESGEPITKNPVSSDDDIDAFGMSSEAVASSRPWWYWCCRCVSLTRCSQPSPTPAIPASFSSQKAVARMTTHKDDFFYNMGHKRRGTALIFNHEHFDIHNLKQRSGTAVDCEQLANCLKDLGYLVSIYHDLQVKELNAKVQEAAKMDHTDCDSFLMAVLSHGEAGVLYTRDTPYKPENLWLQFTADRCPSLAGKPKLFFIQACQGDKLDGGVTLHRTETDGFQQSYKIPTHADFLIAYSTVPGYYSWRNTTNGSWFMQALCTELRLHGDKLDILSLLTCVCRRVATDYESNTPNNSAMHRQKQIPCVTSMLTRLLRFTPK